MVYPSTTEAQYISLVATYQSILAIKRTLVQLQILPNHTVPFHTYNQALQYMMSKPFGAKQLKLIDLRHHFLQDQIKNGRLPIHYVPV